MTLSNSPICALKGFSVLVALRLAVIFSACKDDDETPKCDNGTFQMTLNGEQVEGVSYNNTLLKGSSVGSDGKRMDIRATDHVGRQVIITFTDLSGSNGNCVVLGEYTAFDDVTTGTENVFMLTIIEDGVSEMLTAGEFEVTSCDADARKVSGTFSFSFADTEVTDGSFTNMCYTIL